MPSIKCFFLEPTGQIQRLLRRYASGSDCAGGRYHDASALLDRVAEESEEAASRLAGDDVWPHADPQWPTRCGRCGHGFSDLDTWQVFRAHEYRRVDTDETLTLRDAPPGAMWFADWYRGWCAGPDGHVLAVQTPGGTWIVDDRASNCTRKDDTVHKCWVRHGDPRIGQIHVDKTGDTCSAGAGSILIGGYHGFLHNGHLVEC